MINYFDKKEYIHELNSNAKKLNWTIQIPKIITAENIENIVVDAFEASNMHYWAQLDNSTTDWVDKPRDMPNSQYAVELLLNGKSIKFEDVEGVEDDSFWLLTLDKLLNGIILNAQHRPEDCDLENTDGGTVDCIMQYAILGDVVFG